MKILILANNDIGLYKFRKELVSKLAKEHKVFMCLPDGEYIKKLESIGGQFVPCKLLDRHGTNPIKEFKLISFYRAVLKDIRPDIVLTYTIKPNVYGGAACASLNIPYVANITGLGTAVENGGLLQKITLGLYKFGLRKAQKVFFQNTENRDFMLEYGVVKGAYDMLPGSGVNLSQYQVFDYPEGEIIDFVFVARVMKEKGIEQYLEAAQYIRKKYPNTRFHICGFCEQDYKEKLEELDRQGIVTYHGLVSEMTEVYQMSACTIHPTYYPEGLSNVLLESAASGRPIITTNRSGCREVIDDGVNGYIVKQRDSQDLIEKIEKFLSLTWEERRQMGLAGRAKVEKEFDRQIVVEKYMQEVNYIDSSKNKKYNILLCLNHLSFRSGGVSTHILDLCKEYNKLDEVGKVIVACEWGEHIEKLQTIEKVKYIKTSFWSDGMNPKGIYSSYKQLKRIVKLENIDIVHVHSQRLLFATHLLKIRTGIPYLWTNHIDDIPQQKIFKLMCYMMKFPIISVSQELRKMMIEKYGCNPNKVFVVNNGTDLESLTPLSEQEIKMLYKKYHIDKAKTPYIICQLSRISPIKGQLKLLQAIDKIKFKDKIKVLIAGSVDNQYQEYYESLQQFVDKHNINVEFLGFSEPRDVFGIADLLVLPSVYEGFSLVCIEALAMGCAVIRTKTPGWQEMQEWVKCIEKDNEDELIKSISEALEGDFYREQTLNGQKMVEKLFTKEECARNTLQVYKKLLEGNNHEK
jgi:galacturonosyltransferase